MNGFLLLGFLLHHRACARFCAVCNCTILYAADLQPRQQTLHSQSATKKIIDIFTSFFRVCSPPPSLSPSHAHIRLDKMPGNYCEFVYFVRVADVITRLPCVAHVLIDKRTHCIKFDSNRVETSAKEKLIKINRKKCSLCQSIFCIASRTQHSKSCTNQIHPYAGTSRASRDESFIIRSLTRYFDLIFFCCCCCGDTQSMHTYSRIETVQCRNVICSRSPLRRPIYLFLIQHTRNA